VTATMPPQSLNSSELIQLDVKGHVEPRICTPPLRELTPETSYGFDVIRFAEEVLQQPLFEWQQKLVIRIGELLPNGKPRFKKVLLLIARQNGKTHLVKVLSLYWLFVDQVRLVAGTSGTLKMAMEAWKLAYYAAKDCELSPLVTNLRKDNNDPNFEVAGGGRYIPAAANESSLRGFTVDRLIVDELRLHHNWNAWNAAAYTVRTRQHSQIICITNAGSDASVVLNSLRASAIQYVETSKQGAPIGDSRLGIFEWSAPDNASPMDHAAWAAANPSLGLINPADGELILDPADLHSDAITAVEEGGEKLAGFKTEALCMHVKAMDSAVDADKWEACYVDALDWTGLARRSVLFLDIARNSKRATLVAAYTREDGKTQVGILREWRDENAMSRLEADLEAILKKDKPRAFGWMPIGPASGKATLKNLKVPGVAIEQYTGEVADACMTFADLVRDAMVVHSSDTNDLLSLQVTSAAKKHLGNDRWRFERQGTRDCDAAFAAAGAVLLARSLPPRKTARLISPDDEEEDE
jgi:hypothetical protein